MNEELIAKKELLALTGISYGQLYRWKRKGLIPEEWFIRKSTFTGQETFFPREQTLARIAQIRRLKDDASLDELAGLLSAVPVPGVVPVEELLARNIVSATTLTLFTHEAGERTALTFEQTVAVSLLETLLRGGDITRDEGVMLLRLLLAPAPAGAAVPCEVILLRKLGVATCCLLRGAGDLQFEAEAKIVVRRPLAKHIEQLKLQLVEGA